MSKIPQAVASSLDELTRPRPSASTRDRLVAALSTASQPDEVLARFERDIAEPVLEAQRAMSTAGIKLDGPDRRPPARRLHPLDAKPEHVPRDTCNLYLEVEPPYTGGAPLEPAVVAGPEIGLLDFALSGAVSDPATGSMSLSAAVGRYRVLDFDGMGTWLFGPSNTARASLVHVIDLPESSGVALPARYTVDIDVSTTDLPGAEVSGAIPGELQSGHGVAAALGILSAQAFVPGVGAHVERKFLRDSTATGVHRDESLTLRLRFEGPGDAPVLVVAISARLLVLVSGEPSPESGYAFAEYRAPGTPFRSYAVRPDHPATGPIRVQRMRIQRSSMILDQLT